MEKLTDFQIENLIESIVENKKNIKYNDIKEHYIKKWNNCKTKKEKHQFFNEFFYNRKKLINEGIDTSIDEGILGSLFSSGLGGFKSTFKEWIISKLVGMLGVEDPDLKNALSISIANLDWTRDWTKLMSPLKNCEYFTKQIAHGVMEYYVNKKSTEWFGSGIFASSLRNAVVDSLTEEEHIEKVENAIAGIICKAIKKVLGGGSIVDKIKNVAKGNQSPNPAPSI